jgi:hypothetical protein
MGPVCAKKAGPSPSSERDLFVSEIDILERVGRYCIGVLIERRAAEASLAVKAGAAAARRRLGVAA